MADQTSFASKPIHADHRARMRERVRRDGLDGLAEHEALEYLLFFAIPRRDTNTLAHRLIEHFGSFCNVLEAEEEELAQVEGVGASSAALIHSILELSRYYAIKKRVKRPALQKASACKQYVEPLFLGQQRELLYLIVLDEQYLPLRDIRIAEGVPNKLVFDLSKVVRSAVTACGSCAFLAHNHPHGLSIPSEADITATGALVKALGTVGIDLLDHIIVGDDGSLSLRESGRMPIYDSVRGMIEYP